MPQITRRGDDIAHPLLESFDIGEPAIAFSFPDQLAINGNFEDTAGSGDQRDRTQLQ